MLEAGQALRDYGPCVAFPTVRSITHSVAPQGRPAAASSSAGWKIYALRLKRCGRARWRAEAFNIASIGAAESAAEFEGETMYGDAAEQRAGVRSIPGAADVECSGALSEINCLFQVECALQLRSRVLRARQERLLRGIGRQGGGTRNIARAAAATKSRHCLHELRG
jgi:hypothetical protein